MRVNMGNTDRLLRLFVVAPLLLVAAWAVGFGTALGIIAIVLAVIMVATAAVGRCPLYLPFGLTTCRNDTPATKA